MRNVKSVAVAVTLALLLGGCALMGGGKTPASLVTLSSTAPDPGPIARNSAAGESITIDVPVVAKEIRTTRVAAQTGTTTVAYIKDLTLVDTPDRLFRDLVAETVLRTTNRVVLDSDQATLDPGMVVTGRLTNFGYEAGQGNVLVRYDAAMAAKGGAGVQTRRFEARVPADGTAATVGPALNDAANQVAAEVAQWIGGR